MGQGWVMILQGPSASSVFILSEETDNVSAGEGFSKDSLPCV